MLLQMVSIVQLARLVDVVTTTKVTKKHSNVVVFFASNKASGVQKSES